jgi:hypothetical protein
MAKEGYRLEALPPLPHGANALGALAEQLAQCLDAQRHVPELTGLVLILAPTVLEGRSAFADGIRALLRIPSLGSVRVVVVEPADGPAKPLFADLGEAAMHVEAIVDPAIHREEQLALLAAAAAAKTGATPEVSAGYAGPKDVTAPPRAGKPPRDAPLPPETQTLLDKELGSMAALLGASGALLRQRVLGAALAIQEQRFGDAIRLQTEAHGQCARAGLTRIACVLQMTLAAYLLHAGERKRARTAFEASARHYAAAGYAAERAGIALLAIEAFRTAGQIALRGGTEKGAVAMWTHALGIASKAEPEVTAASSAPIAARALAKILQGYGSYASAESLLAQADDFERPPIRQDQAEHYEAPGVADAGE